MWLLRCYGFLMQSVYIIICKKKIIITGFLLQIFGQISIFAIRVRDRHQIKKHHHDSENKLIKEEVYQVFNVLFPVQT